MLFHVRLVRASPDTDNRAESLFTWMVAEEAEISKRAEEVNACDRLTGSPWACDMSRCFAKRISPILPFRICCCDRCFFPL